MMIKSTRFLPNRYSVACSGRGGAPTGRPLLTTSFASGRLGSKRYTGSHEGEEADVESLAGGSGEGP